LGFKGPFFGFHRFGKGLGGPIIPIGRPWFQLVLGITFSWIRRFYFGPSGLEEG